MILKYKKQKSFSIIEQMLTVSPNNYIALSFGKDSIVMADLIYRVSSNTKCLFLKSEESYLMHDYEKIIPFYQDRGWDIEIVETNRLTENNNDWTRARKKGNKDFYLEPFMRDWTGVFMGLRIDESKGRRISLIRKENNRIGDKIMQYKKGLREGMYRCCPIAYWNDFDVMFYAKQNKLPLLGIYKTGKERTTARLTGNAIREGSFNAIKRNEPERWTKLIELIPELQYYKF